MALIPIAVANGRGPWRGGDMREGVACRGAGDAGGEGHDGEGGAYSSQGEGHAYEGAGRGAC